LFCPTIDKESEYPENFFEIQDQDIVAFKKKKELAALKAKGKQPPVVEEEELIEEGSTVIDIKKQQMPVRRTQKPQVTDLENEFHEIRRIELMFEKEQKQKEIEDITSQFDEEIKEMQKEKYRLESDLKNAEMKLILFFEELILLKSMEAKDVKLTKRLAHCRQEKG